MKSSNFTATGMTDEQKAEILRLWNERPDMTVKLIAQQVGVTIGQASGHIYNCKKRKLTQSRFPGRGRDNGSYRPVLRAIGPNPALRSAHAQLRSQFDLAVKAKVKTDARYNDLKVALTALEALIGDKSE